MGSGFLYFGLLLFFGLTFLSGFPLVPDEIHHCGDCFSARMTREHNDANILCMGERVVGPGLALMIVDAFLDTEHSEDERHHRRVSKIEQI